MSRDLVVPDGTLNEPETSPANGVRLFDMAIQDGDPLVYYCPGAGTTAASKRIGTT